MANPSKIRESISRRQLINAGSIAALGLSLPELLVADEIRDRQGEQAKASRKGTPRATSCIFIHQYGGLSQLDSWDPKPNAPREIRGPYRSIQTATPGFHVCELMPRLSQLSEKYAVIRSMSHRNAQHDQANAMMLAGKTEPKRGDPSFGAMVTKLRPTTAKIPPHLWLQKYGGGAAPPEACYMTGGFLGSKYAPMLIGKTHEDNPASKDFRVRAFDTNSQITLPQLKSRWSLSRQLDQIAPVGEASEFESHELYQQKSIELLQGSEARRAFDIGKEPDSVRDRFGRNPLGQNLVMARRLIESGARLVNVLAWTGLAPREKFVSVETWDMHGNADVGIFENGWNGLPFALPRADQAVAALLNDLEERGLLETTLVVLCGEFGRTPKIRKGAKRIGRDHWPNCYSAMIAGGGVRGGVVYGKSDKHSAYVQSKPVSLEDFTATLFGAMNIPPTSRLSPDGFTIPASAGQVIPELLT